MNRLGKRPVNPFAPLVSRIRYRFDLGFTRDYRKTARRCWEVAPATTKRSFDALFEPEDLERISGISPDGISIESQVAKLTSGEFVHGATVAYEFGDAMVVGGHVLTDRSIIFIGDARLPSLCRLDMPDRAEGVLANTAYGLKYFGHWMADDLPLHMTAADLGSPVSLMTNPSRAQQDYLGLLGLASTTLRNARFERLVILDDAGQNAYKQERYDALRARAAAFRRDAGTEGVMLLRGSSGVRRLLSNEAEIADIARSRGFDVVDPLRTSAEALMRTCSGARVVLGVEGSHLTNGMMWMQPGGTVVSLQPPQRFDTILKVYCDGMGLRYALVVGEARGADDFHVDGSRLQRMLDRVAARPTA